MKKIALFFLLCISISYPITQSQGYAVAMLFETSPYPSNISPVQVAILDTGINGFEDHVIWESDLTYSDDTGDNAGHGTAMAEAIIDTNGAVEIYNIKILDSMSGEVNLINALNVASAGPDGIFGSRDDPEVIKEAHTKLTNASHKIAEHVYKAAGRRVVQGHLSRGQGHRLFPGRPVHDHSAPGCAQPCYSESTAPQETKAHEGLPETVNPSSSSNLVMTSQSY